MIDMYVQINHEPMLHISKLHDIKLLSLQYKSNTDIVLELESDVDLKNSFISIIYKNHNIKLLNKRVLLQYFYQKDKSIFFTNNIPKELTFFQYSSLCQATFSDNICKYIANKQKLSVVFIENNMVQISKWLRDDIDYNHGTVTFVQDNIKENIEILYIINKTIYLKKNIILKYQTLMINTTCDKTYKNCLKYNNIKNFQGCPGEIFDFTFNKNWMNYLIDMQNFLYTNEKAYKSYLNNAMFLKKFMF